jgi:histidyl-tRNA synthetase
MIRAVTGTKDIFSPEIRKWHFLEEIVKGVFKAYNYKEIRTPVFEETALFARGIGEETDIVGKEMYTFRDKSETSLTLKPEMTASVVRAFIEHSMPSKQALNKMYYIAPMFRQERPQAGRFRQFHQFGAEALGSENPFLDAEMIQIAYSVLRNLGLKDLKVKINSLGIPDSREKYKEVLRDYLSDKKEELSEESRKRYEKNILRLFDSKDEGDQKILASAPVITDHLDDESRRDFETVKGLLSETGVPFEVDSKLVRGLDYYTKTTFEIISGKVGSQSALCGGGRYDLLTEQLGGKPAPGVGFAAGMERILLACDNEGVLSLPEEVIDLYIVKIDKERGDLVWEIATTFRNKNYSVEFDYADRSMKANMREANKYNARYVLFIGGDEYKEGYMNLKNMKTGEQVPVPLDSYAIIDLKLKGNDE